MRTLRKNFSANQRKAYKQEKAAAAGFIETVTNVVLSPTKAAESPSGAQSSQSTLETSSGGLVTHQHWTTERKKKSSRTHHP